MYIKAVMRTNFSWKTIETFEEKQIIQVNLLFHDKCYVAVVLDCIIEFDNVRMINLIHQ